jgi:hypothetical protein
MILLQIARILLLSNVPYDSEVGIFEHQIYSHC